MANDMGSSTDSFDKLIFNAFETKDILLENDIHLIQTFLMNPSFKI